MYVQGPPPSRASFHVGGVPVTVSPMHLLLMAFLFYQVLQRSVALGIGVILIASFSVLAHELGHAWTSLRYGLGARIELTGLGGLTYHAPARDNRQLFLVTAAGPAMNFVLAAVLYGVFGYSEGMLAEIVYMGIQVNVVWGIYNLLPIIPLDGGILMLVVLRRVFKRGDRADRIAHWIGLVLGGVGAALGLVQGSMLVAFVLGMAAFENWRALQSLGPAPVQHEKIPHKNVREILGQAHAAYTRCDWDAAARYCHLARNEPFVSTEEMRQIWQILALTAARQRSWDEALRHAERLPEVAEMAQVRAVCLLAVADPARARTFLSTSSAALVAEPQLESLRELARRTAST